MVAVLIKRGGNWVVLGRQVNGSGRQFPKGRAAPNHRFYSSLQNLHLKSPFGARKVEKEVKCLQCSTYFKLLDHFEGGKTGRQKSNKIIFIRIEGSAQYTVSFSMFAE